MPSHVSVEETLVSIHAKHVWDSSCEDRGSVICRVKHCALILQLFIIVGVIMELRDTSRSRTLGTRGLGTECYGVHHLITRRIW